MTDWQPWYRALKKHSFTKYRKAIDYMEGNSINHDLSTKAAADFERAAVMLCCEVLGIEPDHEDQARVHERLEQT